MDIEKINDYINRITRQYNDSYWHWPVKLSESLDTDPMKGRSGSITFHWTLSSEAQGYRCKACGEFFSLTEGKVKDGNLICPRCEKNGKQPHSAPGADVTDEFLLERKIVGDAFFEPPWGILLKKSVEIPHYHSEIISVPPDRLYKSVQSSLFEIMQFYTNLHETACNVCDTIMKYDDTNE